MLDKKVLVTGGAGFIGSAIVKALNGYNEVDVLDDMSHASVENLVGFCGNFYLDIEDVKLEDYDYIFHMGASSSTSSTIQDVVQNNIKLTKRILSAPGKVINASSASVYGNGPTPMTEEQETRPQSPYAFSKAITDNLVLKANKEGSKHLSLRFFNVYGPGETHKLKSETSSPVAKAHVFFSGPETYRHSAGPEYGGFKSVWSPKLFHGSDEIFRNFVYIDDVVSAALHLIPYDGIFNIGYTEPYSFEKVYQEVGGQMGRLFKPEYVDMPEKIKPAYQYYTNPCLKKLKSTGFTPKYDLRSGVREYLKWAEEQNIHLNTTQK